MRTIFLFLLWSFWTGLLLAQQPKENIPGSAVFKTQFEKLVSRADLKYTKPASRSEAGQPIGNGRMGSLVWTNPTQIKLQVNRVDVFSIDSRSNNFYERNTDYCGGVGFVDLDFQENVFETEGFQQDLSCYEGHSTVKGKKVQAKLFAYHDADVMAAQIKDDRAPGSRLMVNLRMLRMPVSLKGNHSALSSIRMQGGNLVLTQVFKEDDFYCQTALIIGNAGPNAIAEWVNETTLRLNIPSGGKETQLFIASAASFDSTADPVLDAQKKWEEAKSKGFAQLLQSNKNWWANFWSKSFIHLSSKDGEADFVEENYTYYLYVMASSSRGDYPVKFNGMLWTTGGDARQWGSNFWGANQSCFYTALFATNHIELLDPMFNMYTKAYSSFETAARQQWGSKGIYIPETMGFDGVPTLPEEIAAEMQSLYLLKKPWEQRTPAFMEYAFTKQPFLSRWNWKYLGQWKSGRWVYTERGDGPYGPVNHIFSRGAKLAYQYWQKYEYTRDLEWLRNQAYPMLKGMAEFYRNFPNLKKSSDGKYHIYHVNDNESIWGAHNPVEEMASMRGIFPALIRAAQILKMDSDMIPIWQEFLENLSPLATSSNYPDLPVKPITWVGSLPPTSAIRGNGKRLPDGNTMPVWFFDLANWATEPARLKIAQNTYDGYFQRTPIEQMIPSILSKIPAAGAMLGRTEAVKYLVPKQLRGAERHPVMENRMDRSEGFFTTNIQRIGRAADALQLGLVQSAPAEPGGDPIIKVFPAWPKDWDAQFTLLCRGNFLVSSSIKNGEIKFVELLSQSGNDVQMANPWKGKVVQLYKNAVLEQTLTGESISFKTQRMDRIVMVPKGISLSEIHQQVL